MFLLFYSLFRNVFLSVQICAFFSFFLQLQIINSVAFLSGSMACILAQIPLESQHQREYFSTLPILLLLVRIILGAEIMGTRRQRRRKKEPVQKFVAELASMKCDSMLNSHVNYISVLSFLQETWKDLSNGFLFPLVKGQHCGASAFPHFWVIHVRIPDTFLWHPVPQHQQSSHWGGGRGLWL